MVILTRSGGKTPISIKSGIIRTIEWCKKIRKRAFVRSSHRRYMVWGSLSLAFAGSSPKRSSTIDRISPRGLSGPSHAGRRLLTNHITIKTRTIRIIIICCLYADGKLYEKRQLANNKKTKSSRFCR